MGLEKLFFVSRSFIELVHRRFADDELYTLTAHLPKYSSIYRTSDLVKIVLLIFLLDKEKIDGDCLIIFAIYLQYGQI